jgi:hypothetical protein
VLFERFVGDIHQFAVGTKERPPAILAIAERRLVNLVEKMPALFYAQMTDGKISASKFAELRLRQLVRRIV